MLVRFAGSALALLLVVGVTGCGDDAASTGIPSSPETDAGADLADAGNGETDASSEADAAGGTDANADTVLVPEFGGPEGGLIVAYAGPSDGLTVPRDLGFNPMRPDELWLFDRQNEAAFIIFDAGTEQQRVERRLDAFRDHFLAEIAAMAFAPDGFFGTCGESRNTYRGLAPPNDFMGPALWTSNLDIFAEVFQDPFGTILGSHMDMLHQSPNCMGIAYDGGVGMNGYWVFDGFNGHLVYYDFAEDHGPGADDHSDGIVRRYDEVELAYVPNVPSHMMLHEESGILYISDTGNDRVLWVDVNTGSFAESLFPENEPLAEFSVYRGVEWGVVAEDIDRPSGLTLNDERLFVGSYGTGEIIAFDMQTREELDRFDTQGTGLMGLELGPDGRLWFVDADFAELTRIE